MQQIARFPSAETWGLVWAFDGAELLFPVPTIPDITERDLTIEDLLRRLQPLVREASPFVSVPREFARGAVWVEPRLVVAVKFVNWTRNGVLRHPSFDGICEGTAPESVVVERAVPVPDTE
jgi:ATP-dependent DNA ligase